MLGDLTGFFGDVTPWGAVALMGVGLLTGFGLHDVAVALWYVVRHDRSRDDDA